MTKKYCKNYEVNYFDTDYKLRCKLSSIVNFLCDVGNSQAESLGETIESLIEKKCAWVFYKYDIKMYKYPTYRQVISVETEPVGFKKFYAYRKYYIKSLEGEILGEALALFFLINIEKRRPMRILKEQYEIYGASGDLEKNIEMDEIASVDNNQYSNSFNIRYSDIDSNGHVNNEKYIEWAIESVPVDIVKDFEVCRVKVLFEKETTYGGAVKVLTDVLTLDKEKIVTTHIIRDSENKELTKIEIEWKRE